MTDKNLDRYDADSLHHLKIASRARCKYFITSNEAMLKDRNELEKKYNIKIITVEEFNKLNIKEGE